MALDHCVVRVCHGGVSEENLFVPFDRRKRGDDCGLTTYERFRDLPLS
jgi:hypothetical protein